MCCEVCTRYEKCYENNALKDNCCSKCLDYDGCMGIDIREKRSFSDPDEDNGEEDEFNI